MKFSFEIFDFVNDGAVGKPAVIGSNRTVNWNEFAHEVNEWCAFFKANNISGTQPIIIYGHKQAEMVIAAYACMKSSIPYIPIDIIYPADRIIRIAEIAGVDLIINCTEQTSPVVLSNELRICQKQLLSNKKISVHLPAIKNPPGDPVVYIIFTSGSTGEPKGVQITRSAVLSFQNWMKNDFGFTGDDVFINQAPFSFDLSVFELMTFSNLGATLLLNTSESGKNPEEFIERTKQSKGSVLVSTPSFAYLYSQFPEFYTEAIPSLKTFLFCGETLPNSLSRKLNKLFSGSKIFNTYGPTEATVATTLVEITPEIFNAYDPLPVGFPKSTSEIRILADDDKNGGEIQIVGDNVSIGYINREELNKEKFWNVNGKRAFNTGDWGYFRDGMLFFTGRKDEQVKLHGFRIELEEINAALHKSEAVDDAITIPMRKQNEVKKLVAVVKISRKYLGVDEAKLKQIISDLLKKNLPEYMVPGDIRFIEKFPYNANHKIDKLLLGKWILEGNMV